MANQGNLSRMISSNRSGRNSETIPLVDVIRVLAAWMVLAWHTSNYIGYRMPIFGSAAIAVDVFMNVSGFLMLLHFWERREKEPWNEPMTWLRFYIRRFFRIAPLYYFCLFFLVVIGLTPPYADSVGTTLPTWQWLLLRFSFLYGFIPHQADNCIMPDWSLTLEMQFYVCFPFLALALKHLKAGFFFFVCASLGAISRIVIGYYRGCSPHHLLFFPQPTVLPLKLHIFAVGMVVALVLIRGTQELKSKWFWAAFPVYLLTCKTDFLWYLAAVYWISYAVLFIPRAREQFFNLLGALDQKAQKLPLRKTLADCSYGTYLIHNIIIALILVKFWPHLPDGQGSLWRFIPAFILMLVLTTMFSYLLHWVVEKPGINCGRKIINFFGTTRHKRPL
jgi:peptidoglycan/LPS O-acetylase OafA/YrhL